MLYVIDGYLLINIELLITSAILAFLWIKFRYYNKSMRTHDILEMKLYNVNFDEGSKLSTLSS